MAVLNTDITPVTHAADALLAPGDSRSLVEDGMHARWGFPELAPDEQVVRMRAVYEEWFRDGDVVRNHSISHGSQQQHSPEHGRGGHRNHRRVVAPERLPVEVMVGPMACTTVVSPLRSRVVSTGSKLTCVAPTAPFTTAERAATWFRND